MISFPARDNRHDPNPADQADRPGRSARRLGLPLIALIGLALLGAPRVVLHDLDIISEGTAINALFVFGPLLVWIVVALWAKVPNAFLTLLTVGVFYGILLAAGHQVVWTAQFDGAPPRLGGNLADLEPGQSNLIVRLFAAGSSLITGTFVGAATGAIAWIIDRLVGRKRQRPAESGSA